MHYPSIVGANGRIAPENISLNGGWKPIDVNEPIGVSIHQDLGQVLVNTMPGHSWMIESDLRDGTFALDGQPADEGHSVRVEVDIVPALRRGFLMRQFVEKRRETGQGIAAPATNL